MSLKRNIKLYIKDKSTIWAIGCLFLFIVTFLISFISPLTCKKGINDNFKKFDITALTTNNYNVIYAISDNHLFYSQNKAHESSLNKFTDVKEYYNEYGSMRTKEYNFIQIDYEFPSPIIEVSGIEDNYIGKGGETLILTRDGYLYLISERNNKVELLLKNIKKVQAQRNNDDKKIYFVQDLNNTLSLCYIENNKLLKHNFYNKEVEDFYFIKNENENYTVLIKENKELYELTFNNNLLNEKELLGSDYKIVTSDEIIKSQIKKINIKSDKIVKNNNIVYSLKDNVVSKITRQNNEYIIETISCDENVEDIYTCGVDACIAICNNHSYYYGKINKQINESTEKFIKVCDKDGKIYCSSNSIILYNKGKLYLYNNEANEFEPMYLNYFVIYGIRYFSLFVVVMTLFYLILSFCEANKRYNRYFKVNNQKEL